MRKNFSDKKMAATAMEQPNIEYTALIKEIEDGWYMAQCEQIPGALTQGKTIEEAKENLKEAICLLLEDEMEVT